MLINNLNFVGEITSKYSKNPTVTNPNLQNNDNSDVFVKSPTNDSINHQNGNITFGQYTIDTILKSIRKTKKTLRQQYNKLNKAMAPEIRKSAQIIIEKFDKSIGEHISTIRAVVKEIETNKISIDKYPSCRQIKTPEGIKYYTAKKTKNYFHWGEIEICIYPNDKYKKATAKFLITPNERLGGYSLQCYPDKKVGKNEVISVRYHFDENSYKMSYCNCSCESKIQHIELKDDNSGYNIRFKSEKENEIKIPEPKITMNLKKH